jgi:hypothetical protein
MKRMRRSFTESPRLGRTCDRCKEIAELDLRAMSSFEAGLKALDGRFKLVKLSNPEASHQVVLLLWTARGPLPDFRKQKKFPLDRSPIVLPRSEYL